MSKVLIIGSGFGGLTCGYILQKNGFDVTILEQGLQIGGCLQCFYRGGAKFETGMHFIGSADPGQTLGQAMDYFGLSEDIRLSRLDTSAYNTISLAGQEFAFPNGREAFMERMSSYFPTEKDAIRKYLDIIDRIAEASSLQSLTSPSRDLMVETQYQTISVDEVLDSIFRDSALKNVLVGDLPLYAARRGKTPFSLHAFIMDFYNRSAFRVVGGSDAIAKSLSERITGMGGEILTGKKAVKVLCDDSRATGVETEDGLLFPADYVISTVHPNRLLEMLDTRLIRPAFRMRINSIPQTPAVFALYVKYKEGVMPYMNTNYFCYSGDSPWGCEDYSGDRWPEAMLYMHMCHEDKAEWARSGIVMSYMDFSLVEKWKGTGIGRRGEEYERFKREHAERIIDAMERRRPGFRASIDSYYTSTPLSYLDYTGTEEGSLYGVAKDVNLGPVGHVPYRTRIPNLFMAGQNVNSHGIMGVLVGTIVTCSALIPVEKLYRQIFEES